MVMVCFRRIVFGLTSLVAVGCTDDKAKEDEQKKEELKRAIAAGDDIEFSGYVQKAFAISVNGNSYSDSEDFYTRFLDVEVKPKYEVLKDATITLEGDYGLEEFGKNAKVFMSSVASDGHLFESRTDGQSKFTLKVKANATDETFKARVIIRIGLEIKGLGGDPKAETENFCYILHGTRDGILITDNTKPIIFDKFSTQLNTYKCDDVKEESLIIPIAGGGSNGEPNGALPDDTTVIQSPDGTTKVQPYITLLDKTKIAIPLASDEEGENIVTGVSFSGGSFHLVKQPVKSKATGQSYAPYIKLTNLSSPQQSTTKLAVEDSHVPVQVLPMDGSLVVLQLFNSSVLYPYRYDVDGSSPEQMTDIGNYLSSKSEELTLFGDFIYASASGYKIFLDDPNRPRLCDFDPNSTEIALNCQEPADENLEYGSYLRPGTTVAGKIYVLAPRAQAQYLLRFNENLVLEAKYVISKLAVPNAALEQSFVVSDDTNLFLVIQKEDELVFNKLQLND